MKPWGRWQTLSDLDALLAKIDPSLPNLSHDLAVAPQVINAYADAAPDLVATAGNAAQLSDTIVARQHDLDAALVSAIGLADIGNDVLATNSTPLANTLHLLVPTTALTNQYNPAITCALKGLEPLATGPPQPLPGVMLLDSFLLGTERYRYPGNLPKVAATGGPQCAGLPNVAFGQRPPFVVTDIDANPAQYGNQGILLNSDALKQALFGPLDGPPRNTAQTGQPG
jgi:ABC-type transporter Mla subunit MlaD